MVNLLWIEFLLFDLLKASHVTFTNNDPQLDDKKPSVSYYCGQQWASLHHAWLRI